MRNLLDFPGLHRILSYKTEYTIMTIIKVISHALTGYPGGKGPDIPWGDCIFRHDAHCTDYDWCVVYDDFPRGTTGTIADETEPLTCPPEQTILVTAEPPSVKVYPRCFTHQFGYALTSLEPHVLPHPNHRIGRGCLYWMANYSHEEVLSMPDYPKSKGVSTVCSAKQQKHTLHYKRYAMVKYISEHMDGLDWFGRGVRELRGKYNALSDYRYHIAIENYIAPYHWSDKISDPLLGLCLTFYAGDPRLSDILPAESFIPIPLDDPPRALEIIRTAMENNEFEKRLPAIREARRLVVEKYNFFAQIVELIHEHQAEGGTNYHPRLSGGKLRGRHTLRRNPIHALSEFIDISRYKLSTFFSKD